MKYIGFIVVTMLFSACTTLGISEQQKVFSKHSWEAKDSVKFDFEISDTTSNYQYQLILRHHEKYLYSNIWLQISVQQPDTFFTFKREFQLADNKQWLGTRMDDITEHRIPFNQEPIPLKKGKYSFTLKQVMRNNPLPEILSVGVAVVKK
jgi:gliding motility-associated lipoprotein GldH